jgi:hypothetical protein
MFATPQEMALEYLRECEYRSARDEYIENAMQEYKTEAVKRLYKIVDPFYAEAMAATLAYGYSDGIQEAVEIVNRMALNDKHIAALMDDDKKMMKIIMEELQEQRYYDQYGD